jgi:hypothetical protein
MYLISSAFQIRKTNTKHHEVREKLPDDIAPQKAQVSVPESFQGVVIEIDMSNFHIIFIQTGYINGKTMVLRSNLHLPGNQVFNRLIGSPMTKFQFECLAPQS